MSLKTIAVILIFTVIGIISAGLVKKDWMKNKTNLSFAQENQSRKTFQSEATNSINFQITETTRPAGVDAVSFMVYDLRSKKVLLSEKTTLELPPASITKLLTAFVVLDNIPLTESVTMSPACARISGSRIGIRAGEVWSVEELLQGMLIASGADATCALSTRIGTPDDVIQAMNLKATALGMTQTTMTNTIGFDDSAHLSTAEDLVKLGIAAMDNPIIAGIVRIPMLNIKTHPVFTTNELLGTAPGFNGIKTGHTVLAGDCLLFSYSDEKYDLIGVVMGSSERFRDTKLLVKAITSGNNITR